MAFSGPLSALFTGGTFEPDNLEEMALFRASGGGESGISSPPWGGAGRGVHLGGSN
jgi:hypothetical protein